jgi:hypothetical protein
MKPTTKALAAAAIAFVLVHVNAPESPNVPSVGPMRALILHDNTQDVQLPAEQQAVYHSQIIDQWLDEHTPKEADGEHSHRVWDVQTDVKNMPQVWQDWMRDTKAKATKLPWLRAEKGRKRYNGALPKDVPSTLEVLKKVGE